MRDLTLITLESAENLNSMDSVLPNEILELIFNFCHHHLPTLCAVSQRWRSIALSQYHLWAQALPRYIPLNKPRNKDPDPHRAHDRDRRRASLNSYVQQCLQRSGSQPISFLFQCNYWLEMNTFWSESELDALHSMLSPLVDECCRWSDVGLSPLPSDVFQDKLVCKVRGKTLQELRTLELCLWPSASPPVAGENNDYESAVSILPPSTSPILIDCFSSAPNLRNVDLNLRLMFSYNRPERQLPIKLDLPWAQLESFKYASYRDDGAYSALLQVHKECSTPSRLQVLDLFINRMQTLPVFQSRCNSLHTLRLRLGLKADLFYSHLDTLTLPSLRDLEIRGPFGLVETNIATSLPPLQRNASRNLYTAVRALIMRSGCSLKQLGLDMGWSIGENGDQQWEGLCRILALSPVLQELDIAVSHGSESTRTLQGLTVDIDEEMVYSYSTFLPDLEILTFRLVSLPTPHTEQEQETRDRGWPTEEEDVWGSMDLAHIFDMASFERLIVSRTNLAFESPRNNVPSLLEVRIVLPGDAMEATDPLLQRIRCACNFKVKHPTGNAGGTNSPTYHWKSFQQDEEVLVLRRFSIARDSQGTESIDMKEEEKMTVSTVRTFPPGLIWDDGFW